MRVGTWNLAGRWSVDHQELLLSLDCDVLLLAEVSDQLELPGFEQCRTSAEMAPCRRWAAVASRTPLVALADPHPASALARVDGWTFCSSVLPWRACGSDFPWQGTRHADRTLAAVEGLEAVLQADLVWGGDWNHALTGREYAGSTEGRGHIQRALTRLRLTVPTSELPHRIDGLLSIDHVAVPAEVHAVDARRHSALRGGRALSDHDAYSVDLEI